MFQVVALPFLHEILSDSIDTVYNDHKICELDIEQLKQSTKYVSLSLSPPSLHLSLSLSLKTFSLLSFSLSPPPPLLSIPLSSCRTRSDSVAHKTLDTSVATLTGYIDTIMTSIFTSVDNCPNMLRQALRQLWVRVAEKYKDPEYTVGECMSW